MGAFSEIGCMLSSRSLIQLSSSPKSLITPSTTVHKANTASHLSEARREPSGKSPFFHIRYVTSSQYDILWPVLDNP